MKTRLSVLCVLISMIAMTSCNNGKSELKIGTYDSRAISYAYFQSRMYEEQQKEMRNAGDSIMKTSDTLKWKATMIKVCTEQYLNHQRFFTTGSIASIMKKVADKLPNLTKTAGVDIVVSKWELTWNDSTALIVDLTDSIAKLFTPLEQLDKTYTEIKKMEGTDIDECTVEEVIEMWTQFEQKYLGRK